MKKAISKNIGGLMLIATFAIVNTSCQKEQNVVLKSSSGDTDAVSGPVNGQKWMVTTVAGSGIAFFNDGPALTAAFRAPQDVAASSDSSLYVADAINHRIRKIAGNTVSTYAGTGVQDTTSGKGSVAGFALPVKVTTDLAGNLYTLDVGDFRVRKISTSDIVTVVAGSGIRGFADGRADTARFGESIGIVVDSNRNIYVSDIENERIRKISRKGLVTTIAGNGKTGFANGNATTAEFLSPSGIVIDKQGNLFVADYDRVRKITPDGTVSTFVGNRSPGYVDGPANVARFTFINDIAIDGAGNIYASDDNRIRKISPQRYVSTIAGSTPGYRDGDGAVAQFNNPDGLGIDSQGNIFVADDNNNRIRKISVE